MRESSTYQAILSEGEARGEVIGRIDEARKTILTLGQKRFGELPPTMRSSLDAIADIDALNKIIERILDAETWDELLTSLL